MWSTKNEYTTLLFLNSCRILNMSCLLGQYVLCYGCTRYKGRSMKLHQILYHLLYWFVSFPNTFCVLCREMNIYHYVILENFHGIDTIPCILYHHVSWYGCIRWICKLIRTSFCTIYSIYFSVVKYFLLIFYREMNFNSIILYNFEEYLLCLIFWTNIYWYDCIKVILEIIE